MFLDKLIFVSKGYILKLFTLIKPLQNLFKADLALYKTWIKAQNLDLDPLVCQFELIGERVCVPYIQKKIGFPKCLGKWHNFIKKRNMQIKLEISAGLLHFTVNFWPCKF